MEHLAVRAGARSVLLIVLLGLIASVGSPALLRAQDPLTVVQDLILSGRRAEAQAAATKAERASARGGDRRRHALSIFVLAVAEFFVADFSAATSHFERSAELLETQQDPFSEWIARWHLGILEKARKKPSKALDHHRRGLALLDEVETGSSPFSVEGLAYVGRLLQMSPNLLRLAEERPEAAKPILLRIAEGMSREGAIEALLELGQLEEAEGELSRLTELSRLLDGMFAQEAAIHLGHLRWKQWRLDEARAIFRQELDRARRQSARELEILEFLIATEVQSGRREEALALCDRALAVARHLGDPAKTWNALVLRAQVLKDGGRFAAAEELLTEALDSARQAGGGLREAETHSSLGLLALEADQREKAVGHFEAAIGLFRVLDDPFYEAKAWLQLVPIYAQFGARASANMALEKARELSKSSDSRLLEAWTEFVAASMKLGTEKSGWPELEGRLLTVMALPEMKSIQRAEDGQFLLGVLAEISQIQSKPDATLERVNLTQGVGQREIRDLARFFRGFVFFQRGELTAAGKEWSAALDEGPRPELEVTLLAFMGLSLAREGKTDEAISHLVRAVAVVDRAGENLRLEDFLAGYLGPQKQAVFGHLVELLLRQGRSAEAFHFAERARARAFLLGLGNPRIEPRAGADASLVAEAEQLREGILALERRAVLASAGQRELLSSDLLKARERYQALLVRLKVSNPSYSSRAKIEPLQLAAVQAELAPETTLISYFVSAQQVHAWVIDKETVQHVPLPLRPADLRGAACWAVEGGQRGGRRGARRVDPVCGNENARAKRLFRKLLAPLRGQIRHQRLIVIPHGELHYIPFAALRDPKNRRYLIEDYTLTYAPSASVLGLLRSKETPVAGNSLVFGAPEELDASLASLPAAREEAEAVARLLGTRPLLGAAATEGRVYKLSGDVDLLHLAAHGLYEPRNPLFSRIALAPDTEHDGNLEMHEIGSDVDLSGVNLVVLSACETARGERSGGDEITSLTRAFLSAGSPGVISTLWSIDDDASAALMKELYRRLLDGASAAEALRQAQLTLLRDSAYRDPYYWAAFSLTGDPQGRFKIRSPGEMEDLP